MDQLWYRARIPLPLSILARARADVVYSPDFTAPPAGRTPRIVTVHDLAFEICPERAPAGLRRYLQAVVPRQVALAARVVAVSETTRADLIERYRVDPAKIVVASNGVAERFFSASPLTAEERSRLGLPDRYILTVGTLEPRKNHLTLFRAMELLGDRFDYPLVVAGRRGWETAPILSAAEPLVRAGQVRMLDYVPEQLLPGLYAGARCLVYPSWYEGFGLPVVEALAVGIPVVASTAPALREVGGCCARYVDPADPEAIAGAIVEAVSERERAPALVGARKWQARRYSWEAAGQVVAGAIREVAGR
jgi:glycosyltransferase involved in cell wall biosynthesis